MLIGFELFNNKIDFNMFQPIDSKLHTTSNIYMYQTKPEIVTTDYLNETETFIPVSSFIRSLTNYFRINFFT